MRLSLSDVEERVSALGNRNAYDRQFLFDLLLAYGKPKGNVTRLRSTTASSLNVAADPTTEVAQKNVVYFKEFPPSSEEELLAAITSLEASPTAERFTPRFLIVTDYDQLLAKDTLVGDTLAINIAEIGDHATFFLPWAGMEKAQYAAEAHADVKAAERMAKLFDELVKENPDIMATEGGRHSLNIFFTRLLFCFFAEDTGIFEPNQFTNAVSSLTHLDGSDVQPLLQDLFQALDTEDPADKPAHLRDFPYVNGRLFAVTPDQTVPMFSKKARDFLVESGKLQWGQINPDIFGSMFQAVVSPGQRSEWGQHYTSVPNILKTIEPLFMDQLREQFDAADTTAKLEKLLDRISKIKVFDPACGSGNFLVIAYKELRKLEHQILERIDELEKEHQLFSESRVNIENFYGIEIDDFPAEVAVLALWIAKHQMNQEFQEKFNVPQRLIPLKEAGSIRNANAARISWNDVCPNNGRQEIYLIGNPPYMGAKRQSKEQKADYAQVFGERPFNKNLDYISLWFVKGADYIQDTNAQLAFVTTNSVSQGEHVSLLFPLIFSMGIEIGYAYTSFKWANNARSNAGVTVAVICLRNTSTAPKYIFEGGVQRQVKNINGYLADGPDISITRSSRPLSARPPMVFGSMPRDGGGLILTERERHELLVDSAEAEEFVKLYLGSTDVINGTTRYCLWIEDADVETASSIDAINRRLQRVRASRESSDAASTAGFAEQPHRFVQISYKPTEALLVPSISSERREYIPMGYVGPDVVASNKCFAVYDAEPWLFGLLSSRMHMAWVNAVSGRMEMRYQYSNTIVYNNFPVPSLSAKVKGDLSEAALRVLDVREYHSEKTLAELYDPDLMPDNLRLAHSELDALVDSIYRKSGFSGDEERLSYLFGLYSQMVEAEEASK